MEISNLVFPDEIKFRCRHKNVRFWFADFLNLYNLLSGSMLCVLYKRLILRFSLPLNCFTNHCRGSLASHIKIFGTSNYQILSTFFQWNGLKLNIFPLALNLFSKILLNYMQNISNYFAVFKLVSKDQPIIFFIKT